MKPMRIELFLFAENEQETEDLEKKFFDFIYDMYQDGIRVQASRLSKAIDLFRDSFWARQFFK